jgi:hypothetical protein
MRRQYFRVWLRRWHRRLGLVSAFFVLWLAVTGITLNHTHELGLDSLPLENSWLRSLYGVGPVPATAGSGLRLPAGELIVSLGRLQLADRDIGACPQLVAAIEQAAQWLVVCRDRLWLLTPAAEVIDQADSVRGVPDNISALAQADGRILLRTPDQVWAVNLADLSLAPHTLSAEPSWQAAALVQGPDLDWEQALLDLHSGRLFGTAGVLLMDVMALLFAVLALTGVLIWWRRSSH